MDISTNRVLAFWYILKNFFPRSYTDPTPILHLGNYFALN